MSVLESPVFFAASLLASVAGAICGIGGGVIVKPTLELFGWEGIADDTILICTSYGGEQKACDLPTGDRVMHMGSLRDGVIWVSIFMAP